jgi:MoaA/NifB/PqqE/SkfB family radical SAM enzyme
MNAMTPGRLRTLVLHVSDRCDQACAHCAIWRRGAAPGEAPLSDDDRAVLLAQARSAGATEVLFTGGEPFLHAGLEPLCRRARTLGLKVWIATNGMSLGRSPWASEVVDELFVSLEGPEDLHDAVRGRGSWRRLARSVDALRSAGAAIGLTARHVLQRTSLRRWRETAATAEAMGFDRLSFLPVDTTSDAFGGDPAGRAGLAPSRGDVELFRREVEEAAADWPRIVAEDSATLASLADRMAGAQAPRCNAPEWSIVVENDGRVRPCFFQPSFERWSAGRALSSIHAGPAARAALAGLHGGNATCRACACPKWREAPLLEWARSARAAAAATFS